MRPPKPHPAPLLWIAEQWSLSPKDIMMVGDHSDDISCGVLANVGATVHLAPPKDRLTNTKPHIQISSLTELKKLLEKGFSIEE